MASEAWGWWLNGLQLLAAGGAVMIAVYEAVVWRWEGSRSSAPPVLMASSSAAVVLVTNATALTWLSTSHAEFLLFVRAVAVTFLLLSVVALARIVCRNAWPGWVDTVAASVILIRLALWTLTDLVFAHRVVAGLPQYGPLMVPTALATEAVVAAYVVMLVIKTRSHREEATLAVGWFGSLVVAALAVLTDKPVVAEVLVGSLALPALTGMAAVVWLRQNRIERAILGFASRQRAFADFSRTALTVTGPDLDREALKLLSDYPSSPTDSESSDEDFRGAVTHVWAAAADRAQTADELDRRATTDDLTGLPNRQRIRERIREVMSHSGPSATAVAVVFGNLNRLGAVNDADGHAAGDHVLRVVADRLAAAARPCDLVGRFGSDEFVVVCSDIHAGDSVGGLVARFHAAVREPITTAEGTRLHMSDSVGVMLADPTERPVDPDLLLRDAMTAMHHARAQGVPTGRFHTALREAAVTSAHVERALVGAVERGEIAVHYQPIVDLLTGTVAGFEALARWRQDSVLIAPGEWIPAAEKTEVIHQIGEHVLITAAAQVARWHRLGHHVSLSVNVSAPQLGTQRLENAVEVALGHLPIGSLMLEITESLALDQVARETLTVLRDRGVRTALDDFGTGVSALAAIATLPIHTIKIDRAITSLVPGRAGESLVTATLAMAKSLGLSVVVEGIETRAQGRALVDLGCRFGQGYHFSRPVDQDAALALLQAPPLIPTQQTQPQHRLAEGSSSWPTEAPLSHKPQQR
jgi:diguanylate cyclase